MCWIVIIKLLNVENEKKWQNSFPANVYKSLPKYCNQMCCFFWLILHCKGFSFHWVYYKKPDVPDNVKLYNISKSNWSNKTWGNCSVREKQTVTCPSMYVRACYTWCRLIINFENDWIWYLVFFDSSSWKLTVILNCRISSIWKGTRCNVVILFSRAEGLFL